MNPAILEMLKRYECRTTDDYRNACQEMMQQIALLGLWRARFFEHAAFYGGTALRILHQLDRFSEDLDFSLLAPQSDFSFSPYLRAITTELASFGFHVTVDAKQKQTETAIQSAFIKANTLKNFVAIEMDQKEMRKIHIQNTIRIKLEIDTDPPANFDTDVNFVLWPIPFSVRSYSMPDLFAGKLHAVLCRAWETRVKGRDFYDWVWYVTRGTPVHLKHLETRLRQSGHYLQPSPLTRDLLIQLLEEKIKTLDIESARADVGRFLASPQATAVWSRAFFLALCRQIQTI